MPRDTGRVSDESGTGEPAPEVAVAASARAAPRTVGDRLRAAREARGLTLADMAELTKVRRAYLDDIEAMRIEALPSRPYAVGYVRAYAEALELDPDALVARFRAETPEPDQTFRAPVGVAFEERNRLSLMAAGAGAVVAAILLWNVVQRVDAGETPAVAAAAGPEAWTLAAAPSAPLAVGPPTPPPPEQTTPAPYVTPGMAEYFAEAEGQILPVANAAPPPAHAGGPVQAAFNPRGAVYGAVPQRSTVILQARKPAFIIVRGKDDAVHFARQLAAGEAYRAPTMEGLTVEVSNPADFDLYRDGELQGPLPAPQTSLDKLAMSGGATPAG